MNWVRLLPRNRRLFSYAELWADETQFLAIESWRWQHRYKRFRFDEIEAVLITALPTFNGGMIVRGLITLAILSLLITLEVKLQIGRWLAILLIWPVIFFVLELLRGNRCHVEFVTATGGHVIKAVSHERQLPKFLTEAEARIAGVQGPSQIMDADPAMPQEAAAPLPTNYQLPLWLTWLLSVLGLAGMGAYFYFVEISEFQVGAPFQVLMKLSTQITLTLGFYALEILLGAILAFRNFHRTELGMLRLLPIIDLGLVLVELSFTIYGTSNYMLSGMQSKGNLIWQVSSVWRLAVAATGLWLLRQFHQQQKAAKTEPAS
jgi:hypothetical protein